MPFQTNDEYKMNIIFYANNYCCWRIFIKMLQCLQNTNILVGPDLQIRKCIRQKIKTVGHNTKTAKCYFRIVSILNDYEI